MSYKPSITFTKGGKELFYATGASGGVVLVLEVVRSRWGLPWGQEQDIRIAAAVFAALVGGLKSLRNWIKETWKRRRAERRIRALDGFMR